jgi:hypothetical protein
MNKFRIYIVQAIGILLLICGYFISDAPDNRSAMHFNLSESKVMPTDNSSDNVQYKLIRADRHEDKGQHHKIKYYKRLAFKVVIAYTASQPVVEWIPENEVVYHYAESYYFLFEKEINPPPPKMS